jgi:hypothetical protein
MVTILGHNDTHTHSRRREEEEKMWMKGRHFRA